MKLIQYAFNVIIIIIILYLGFQNFSYLKNYNEICFTQNSLFLIP
jgi:hypothetical protein